MEIALVFIFGLFLGSFLNVVIFRLRREETFVRGRSKCLFCSHQLHPQDLIPFFSYFYLGGKCRYCKHKFSVQYPLVELLTALSLVLVFIKVIPSDIYQATYMQWLALLNWWVAVAFLILIFVYDLKYYLVADAVVLPATAIAFVFNLVLGMDIWQLLLACLVGAGFFLLQFVVSKGKWIGEGDIRIGLFMGALLGWPHVLLALVLSYTLGSVISIFLILGNKKKWTDRVPFGTFLTMGTFATLLYGSEIIQWYFNLFSFY